MIMTKTYSSSFLVTLLLHSLLLNCIRVLSASNTINTAQIIRDGDTIVSSDHKFEIGFFSPGSSENRYVGLWYKNMPSKTVVWVANRESPLRNKRSGILKFDTSGNLVILDSSNNNNNTVWSTNRTITSVAPAQNPVFARLLDSGNLVITDDGNNYLWQSFDYHTDSFIPGMYFGWNLVTGRQIYQSSWKSEDDPAKGDFTSEMDITGYPQILIKKGDITKVRVGPYNGLRFSGTADLQKNHAKYAEMIINSSIVYYTWIYIPGSLILRSTLSPAGIGQIFIWVDGSKDSVVLHNLPADICDHYKTCGAYGICNSEKFMVCSCLEGFVPRDQKSWDMSDWSGGCVSRTALNCWDDGFLRYTGIKMPDARFTTHNKSGGLKECEAMCLSNCSCTAYSSLDISDGSGCLMWFGDLLDIRLVTGEDQDIYIRMPASELGSGGMNRTTFIAILVSLPGFLLLGLTTASFIIRKTKNYRRLIRKEEMPEDMYDEEMELPMYDLYTVSEATNSFSLSNKLGEGGFGPVYKGVLQDGKEIAVKRLSQTSSQGLEEFRNEVICISKLQHRNLVKLLGWCVEGEEKMLIYEFMPNKSLDLILFAGEVENIKLDWRKRLHIIDGIARGLLYLHQDSCLRVIHRDLKASNVLLDNELNPKISDFGMARIFGGNETEGKTKRVVGTYGYMSPEYALEGLFSLKSDVFSFGVLVLEIVSGNTNRGFHHNDHHHNLVGHAWMLYKQGRFREFVDPNIANTVNLNELVRPIHVGLLCVQKRPEDRPSMSSVVLMLGSGGILPVAKEPGFFAERHGFVYGRSNEYSITQIEGR